MSLRVADPGLFSLIVAARRMHTRALGVPLGGAADRAAFALGNALVGNAPDTAALEVTLAGPTLDALHPVACVLFGAPFQLFVNGEPFHAPGTTFSLKAGDRLRIGGTPTGARGYFCVAGGFTVARWFGSGSALAPLAVGEHLECPSSMTEPRGIGRATLREESTAPTVIRAVDGPQRDWFVGDAFFAQHWEVSGASNRMGVRFTGVPLPRTPGELVSEAVAPGAVQVANDGLPIALGVDGQTIGGYPKVAHVVRADLDVLGQLRPGQRVRFARVTFAEAEEAAHECAAELAGWLTRLRIAERAPKFG